jgi:hypothetical protein
MDVLPGSSPPRHTHVLLLRSFLRYRGVSAKSLHERVKAVEVVDPYRARFVLHMPWPDFPVFYATPATGAAWIVPKKYVEKVGEEGFKRQPVGLGPYRFVRLNPGVELVLEANEQYWRKKPSIKRVVIKGVPDRTTRLAMLKTGEADIGYLMIGLEAMTIKDDPKLRLAHVILLNEILAIGVALTPNFVRLARSLALTIREQDYILAVRALGSGQLRVMARHVFPNALYALVVVGTLYIATAIRTEAGLSFLGLGMPPPTATWGNILSEGRQYIKCCPWITTFSGLAIMLAVLAFNLVGDALRDLLDPRLRGE